jgi:hypothetical protein
MSSHAIRRPASRAVNQSDDSSSSKRNWMIAIALLLVMIGAAWAYLRPSPLDKVMAMQAEIQQLPRDEQRQKWRDMRGEIEKLSEADREAFFAPMMQDRELREQKRMDEFFSLSKAEQIKEIDKDIDREQKWRKERAQREKSGKARKGGGDRGFGGRGGSRDSAERRKASLDRTSPQQRGQRDEYRRMRDDRRAARGIS